MSNGVHVVVGPGREATQVAAALAAAGGKVTLVRTAPCLPVSLACSGGATWTRAGGGGGDGAQVHGPVQPAAPVSMGVFAGGDWRALPLDPWAMGAVLPKGQRRKAARSWLRARARNSLAVVVGGGQEERTYRDWVVRRMGQPTFDALYADYAERRWGRPADDLSSSVARMAHSPALAHPQVEPADPRDHSAERAEALLSAQGVRVVEAAVQGFDVEGGQVVAVHTADESLSLADARFWTTLSPAGVAQHLGEACPPTAQHLAPLLASVPAVRLCVSSATAGLPRELHILDPAPCWRLVRSPTDAGVWIISATGRLTPSLAEDVRDFAVQAGLVGADSEVHASAEVPGGVPVWGPVDHARLRTVLAAWQRLGILATGSGGTLSNLDPTQLVAHVQLLRASDGPDLHEAWRTIAAPPTRIEDLDAQVTRFFAGV